MCIRDRQISLAEQELKQVKSEIRTDKLKSCLLYTSQLKTYIEKVYQQEKEAIDKEWLKITLDKFYHPEKYFLPEEVVIKPVSYTHLVALLILLKESSVYVVLRLVLADILI